MSECLLSGGCGRDENGLVCVGWCFGFEYTLRCDFLVWFPNRHVVAMRVRCARQCPISHAPFFIVWGDGYST